MPGRTTTNRQRDLRRREVYDALVSGRWNARTRDDLCAKHGVGENCIYADYKWVMARVRRPKTIARTDEEERELFLLRLRDVQAEARTEKRFGPLASLLALEARVLGVAEPVRIDVHHGGAVGLAVTQLSDEDLRLRVEELRTKTAGLLAGPAHEVVDVDYSVVVPERE